MAEREIVELVRGVPLFSALEDEDIQALADAFQREEYSRYATVYRQGDVVPIMYVIASGEGALLRMDQEGVERRVGSVERGDVLGAMSLFTDDDRDVSLLTTRETILYSLSRNSFQAVTATHPHIMEALSFEGREDLRQRIEVEAETRRFPWLRSGENTVLCTRRHVWAFQRKVILSVLLAVVALLFQVVLWFVPELAYLSGLALGLAVLLPLLLIGFFYLDWRNDYFVVTNQRVVHEERVFAFLGRQLIYQASLRNLQNVNIDQEGFYARSFDFGDVIIDTAGPEGTVIFDMVPAPSKYRDVIMDLHYRAETRSVAERRAEMQREIEERLGKPLQEQGSEGLGEAEPALPPAAAEPHPEPARSDQVLRNFWGGLQDYLAPQIRFERGGTVTYRKHWVILFQAIWQPTALLLLLVILLVTRLLYAWPPLMLPLEQAVSPLTALLVFLVVLPAVLFWWWWRFEDWRNDLYQVTPNSVVDAKRNPLIFGEKRELQAPLANVQNVKAETMGFIGRLFKLGKVVIQTAGAEGTLEWEYVYNPSAVAEDVSRRVRAFVMKQEEAHDLEQANVLAEWFALYHQTTHPDDYASGESSPVERYRIREEEPQQEEAAPEEDYPLY